MKTALSWVHYERSCLLVKEFFPHTFSLMPYFESNVILCLLFCAFLFFPYSSLKAYYSVFLRDVEGGHVDALSSHIPALPEADQLRDGMRQC